MASVFRNAILSQPENLRAGRDAFAEAVNEIDLRSFTDGTIVFSGIGASAHAVMPAVLALRAAGRRAFAISPQELTTARASSLGDAFVLVSQSGASVETVEALAHLDGARAVAISARGESPLVEAAGAWLPLGPLEDTHVATLSYTATLQALGMLCDTLLGTSSGWRELPDVAHTVLQETDATVRQIAESFASVVAIDAIGGGVGSASAGETALLAREALRVPAAGMETREFLHGPLEATDHGFGCVVFGRERELELASELASFGATVTLVTDHDAPPEPTLHSIQIPNVAPLAIPVLQILPIQLLVDQVARLRGLEIRDLRRQQPDTKVV